MASQLTYKSAGVNISANDALVGRIQRSLKSTHDERVLSSAGGFAGLFSLGAALRRYENPVLVGCCDGVGSKVLLAAQAKKLDSVGIDLVAMNVNDLITCGAQPLFFLDYVALNKNVPRQTASIVEGIARGCRKAGCALLGGETAEMPDVYKKNDFDLAGFAVGIVNRKHLITGRRIRHGDAIIGLASSGVHSNGYSLVRRVLLELHGFKLTSLIPGSRAKLGKALLTPTRIYVKPVMALLKSRPKIIKGFAHITGGGLPGNVARLLPSGCRAEIDRGSWKIPPIFEFIQSLGVSEKEMYRVFNMGIGMAAVVKLKDAQSVISHFKHHKIPARVIGRIAKGRRAVHIG